jgi:hypothetical protein
MRKRTTALVCAALSAAGLAVAPGAASASAAQCGNYAHVCLWADKNYNTSYGAWSGSVSSLPPALYGKVSSYINRLPGAIYFYGRDGAFFCVDPNGSADPDLADNWHGQITWNDFIVSFKYFPGGFCNLP